MHIDDIHSCILIMYLTGQPGDSFPFVPSLAEGVVLMSTYEEFMIILTTGIFIIAILNLTHKNSRLTPVR